MSEKVIEPYPIRCTNCKNSKYEKMKYLSCSKTKIVSRTKNLCFKECKYYEPIIESEVDHND